jgi:SAM-dependent methyltransferase
MFDDLVTLGGLGPDSRVLEIGSGTGRATLPLVERGLELVCVELGERMAAVARKKLEGFPAQVVVGAFEDFASPAGSFDAVVSFEAFHWVEPEVAYEKAHRVLRADGLLALGGTVNTLPDGGDRFWSEVQEDYEAVVPHPDNRPPPRPEDVEDLRQRIENSGRFRFVLSRGYPRDVEYTADEYVALMGTFSANLALDPGTRGRLFDRIRRRIEARPEGRLTAHYLFMVNLARRL